MLLERWGYSVYKPQQINYDLQYGFTRVGEYLSEINCHLWLTRNRVSIFPYLCFFCSSFINLFNCHITLAGPHIALSMGNARVDDWGILSTVHLNGSHNQICQMTFDYSMQNGSGCQLSVFLKTATWLLLWTTGIYTATENNHKTIAVPCEDATYRVFLYYDVHVCKKTTTYLG